MTKSELPQAVMTDKYTLAIETVDLGTYRYGWFPTAEIAMDYAMKNRSRLGLDQCLLWDVEHEDA